MAEKMKAVQVFTEPIKFKRADPAALAGFDPITRICTMNCGPHRQDPRTSKERKFLCDDCMEIKNDGK